MKTAALRKKFINFFEEKQHHMVPSSSLIPVNDPTLLFVNAGMVPFKDVFLGDESRSYKRATSVQRCVRAGGKHNDLENVGYTARHHTFFEMLGNFSFGDYFKKEAIEFAWEFLTKTLNLPQEKLWITVYKDDKEAEDIWFNHIGVSPDRFSRCGEKDNFWSMGDTGPCGPCSEIFYDHGKDIPGGPPGSPDEDGDRYIEIWNLVFMQYNRGQDGKLNPLPSPSVDTGMGLERIAAVLQGVHNNYEIDLFQFLLNHIAKLSNQSDTTHTSMRVIADHIRSSCFLISDGVVPSNEGRGYVLRRIIRRAIRHGHQLGIREDFFYKLVSPLADIMGDAYPELVERKKIIEEVLLREEQQFARTLDQGLKILEQDLVNLEKNKIPGETIFKLYDTYGFPVDLTADIARERGLELDYLGFEECMSTQRAQSQAASKFAGNYETPQKIQGSESEFSGYTQTQQESQITELFHESHHVDKLTVGMEGILVLNKTPFYAESGGQIGDRGIIEADNNLFEVKDTQKQGHSILHFGCVKKGEFLTKQTVMAKVNANLRLATALNHSATHLLHAALKHILGHHVQQKGSLVDEKRLRFDFSHPEVLTPDEINQLENVVNTEIRQNHLVDTALMSIDEAKQSGAVALFGEKYDDSVRVLSMGEFSKELCGGTHVKSTGDIGLFKITNQSGIAAGVRRLEAVTGEGAIEYIQQLQHNLQTTAELLKTQPDSLIQKAELLVKDNRELTKQLDKLKNQLAQSKGGDLLDAAVDINGISVLAAELSGIDNKAMRTSMDKLKQKLDNAIIVLATQDSGRVNLIAGVSKSLTPQFHAGKLINFVAEQVGGKGGGRPDMAQAGGSHPEHLQKALDSVVSWVTKQVDCAESN